MTYPKLIGALLLAGALATPFAAPLLHAETAASGRAGDPQAQAQVQALDRITVETVGTQGPDIILVPGLSTPRAVWDGVAQAMQGEARLHLVEINGFGDTAAGPNGQGGLVQGAADQIARYADALGLDQPILVGHSLGGAVAMLAATDHPQQFGKVMVIDSAPFLAQLFDPEATPDSARVMAGQVKQQILTSPAEARSSATAQSMATTPAAVAAIKGWIEQAEPQAVAEGTSELLELDLRPRLSALTMPFGVVHPDMGDGSARYEQIYADVPDARFVAIPDSGHFVMLDNPEAFLTALRDFIAARPDVDVKEGS